MHVLVGPIHLGDVYQAFYTLFQLSKTAVVGKIGDLGFDTAAFGITASDLQPGIFAQLFQAQ